MKVSTKIRPDFCIVGHSKSGTTALHNMLSQHPMLYMSDPKEPNFFATDLTRTGQAGAFTKMSSIEYAALFKNATDSQLCGESSASNIYSKHAAAQMAKWNPDLKLIAIFREPANYLFSYHQQLLKNPIADGEAVKSFRRALDLEENRIRGRHIPNGQKVPELLYYSKRVEYSSQLSRIFKHFHNDQVLVLIYDDFCTNNSIVLREVCEFLGINGDFDFEYSTSNPSVGIRSKVAQNTLQRLSHGVGKYSVVKSTIRTFIPQTVSRSILRYCFRHFAFTSKPMLERELEIELKKRFRDEVVRFSQLINRDLVSEWGYNE